MYAIRSYYAQEIEALLHSPEMMDSLIFSRLPPERIAAFRAEGLARSLALATAYWEA